MRTSIRRGLVLLTGTALLVCGANGPAQATDESLSAPQLGALLGSMNWAPDTYLPGVYEWQNDSSGDNSGLDVDLLWEMTGVPRDNPATTHRESRALVLHTGGNMSFAMQADSTISVEVGFAIDVNGDDSDDFYVENQWSRAGLAEAETHVFAVSGSNLIDTGRPVAWRSSSGPWAAIDWVDLGIQGVQVAATVYDPAPEGTYDWAPDGFTGVLELPRLPSPPRNVKGEVVGTGVKVSWDPPLDAGLPAVTGFKVSSSPGGATCTTEGSSCEVGSLQRGVSYSFSVTAMSMFGESQPGTSGSVTVPLPPSPPQNVVGGPGDRAGTVTWSPPANGGTAPVTGYAVTATPGGASCSTSGLFCTVGGLVNQQSYTFSVVAISAHGQSAPAMTGSVVPQPFVQIKLKARRSGNVLHLDVNPNLPKKAYWRFQVERQVGPDQWVLTPKTYRTTGSKETRTLNFKKGTYRVVVLADNGYQRTTSKATVYLKK